MKWVKGGNDHVVVMTSTTILWREPRTKGGLVLELGEGLPVHLKLPTMTRMARALSKMKRIRSLEARLRTGPTTRMKAMDRKNTYRSPSNLPRSPEEDRRP